MIARPNKYMKKASTEGRVGSGQFLLTDIFDDIIGRQLPRRLVHMVVLRCEFRVGLHQVLHQLNVVPRTGVVEYIIAAEVNLLAHVELGRIVLQLLDDALGLVSDDQREEVIVDRRPYLLLSHAVTHITI